MKFDDYRKLSVGEKCIIHQIAMSDIEKASYYKQEAVNKHFFCLSVTRIQILALCRHIHKFQ